MARVSTPSFIVDLPSWSQWNPVETEMDGAVAFGGQISLNEAIPGLPERRAAVRVGQWEPYSQLVWMEKRGLFFNAVRYYEIDSLGPTNCILANGVIFSGLRGEMFHDRHRKTIKAAYGEISERLRKLAEG